MLAQFRPIKSHYLLQQRIRLDGETNLLKNLKDFIVQRPTVRDGSADADLGYPTGSCIGFLSTQRSKPFALSRALYPRNFFVLDCLFKRYLGNLFR